VTHPSLDLTRHRLTVRSFIRSCTQCPLRSRLSPGQTPVPFSGPLHPRYIVLGEAPGVTEQRHGEPFVGVSGRLLRRMLAKAGLDVDRALFLNTVCCNPYGAPERSHLDACRPNFDAQLDLAPPSTPLLAAGQTALSSLAPDGHVRRLQGSALVIDGRPVMPVYHPAYLLRDPTAKPGVVEALSRFRALVEGFTADFFLAPTCLLCPDAATEWDDRQMPYCRKHKVEIRKAVNRAKRRRKSMNQAAQQHLELT